ncbi:MAG: hypothetical protein LUD02_11805 [Tannerellaceae bacterium]|nr:hypothetical protein [Tannerellaceae bacterium]MCD8264735.1 hypothetical protein [Tannerellaceae bacterium]
MKRKYLIVLVSLLGLVMLPACMTSNTIKGDGNCVKHAIPVADYDQIKISGAHVVLNYSQDVANGFLEVEVDQNIYDIFLLK